MKPSESRSFPKSRATDVRSSELRDPNGKTLRLSEQPLRIPLTLLEGGLTVERPPGRVIGRSAHPITILDLFDRSHLFARWWRQHG